MKKITLLLTACFFLLFANATIVIDETFNFSATNLASESSWTTVGTLTTGTGRNLITPPLSYSNAGGTYALSGLGKAVSVDITSNTDYKSYKPISATALNSGVVYVSFLYKAGVIQSQTGVEIFGLASGTSQGPRIYVGKTTTTGNWKFGITRSSTTTNDAAWASTEFNNVNEVVFIVMKYNFSTLSASFYLNPSIGGTEPVTASATEGTASTGRTSLNNLWFRATGSSMYKYVVGNARVSTTWAEAVAAQSTATPLSTPTVGTASSIGATGFIANWTSVDNAVAYDVKVYLGSNLYSTSNVSGQASNNLAITGLMSGLTYTYKVIAKGDITNFSDSDPSASSAAFNTTDPNATSTINTDFSNVSWGEPALTQPATGTYPSSSVNGFDLTAAVLYTTNGVIKGIKGESHTNRIAIDKITYNGKLTFPTVNSVEQVEIHATAGTAGNGFQLKEFNATTNTWDLIGTTRVYDAASKASGLDSIYIIPISRAVPTKFRIDNPSNGGVYILQIITRTTNPALLAKPEIGSATAISATSFTANWTAVPLATAYKVYVYQGTTLISGAPFSISGQSSESLAINDLTAETAYTFKVQAIGDGDITLSDSFLSFPALVTTSTATGVENKNQKMDIFVNGKTISTSELGNIQIYNLQGSQITSAKQVDKLETNLPSGLYIVHFTNNEGKQYIQKITL